MGMARKRKKGEGMMVDGWMCLFKRLPPKITKTIRCPRPPNRTQQHTSTPAHLPSPQRLHTRTSTSPRIAPLQHPPKKKSLTSIKLAGKGKTRNLFLVSFSPLPSPCGPLLRLLPTFSSLYFLVCFASSFSSLSFPTRSGLDLVLGWFGRGWRGWGRR